MNTDALLRSYGMRTFTTAVIGPPEVAEEDLTLLAGETDGLAIDATIEDPSVPWDETEQVQFRDAGDDLHSNLNQFLDNDGTSPKLVPDGAGGLRWTRHNLIPKSEEFEDWASDSGPTTVSSDVEVAPDGETTADKIIESVNNTFHTRYNGFTMLGLTQYTFSIYAKAAERDWFRIVFMDSDESTVGSAYFNLGDEEVGTVSGGTAAMEVVGDWIRCSFTRTNSHAAGGTGYFYLYTATDDEVSSYDGDGTSGLYFWGAQVNRGPTPLVYLINTGAGDPRIGCQQCYDLASREFGILIEPEATNFLAGSETINAPYFGPSGSGTAYDVSNITAPDGNNTGYQWEVTAFALSLTSDAFPAQDNITCTFSIFAKWVSGTSWIAINYNDGSSPSVTQWFDVRYGILGNYSTSGPATYVDSTITLIGNGWYRCTLTASLDTAVSDSYFGFGPTAGNLSGAATTAEIGFWGAQGEVGSRATSYIPVKPVADATSTRDDDNIRADVNGFVYSQTVGTIYADYIWHDTANGIWTLFEDNNNFIEELGKDAQFVIYDASVEQANNAPGIGNVYTYQAAPQVSCAWQASSSAISRDGSANDTPSTGTIPNAVTQLRIGYYDPSSPIAAFLRRLIYVPRRVSNGDLPTWRYEQRLLLDAHLGSTGAWSMQRKLRADYAGSAFRLFRDSDDAELDIGFDANGDVDDAAAASFLSLPETGYVDTIYDQSGNGWDLAWVTDRALYAPTGLNSDPSMNFPAEARQLVSTNGLFGAFIGLEHGYMVAAANANSDLETGLGYGARNIIGDIQGYMSLGYDTEAILAYGGGGAQAFAAADPVPTPDFLAEWVQESDLLKACYNAGTDVTTADLGQSPVGAGPLSISVTGGYGAPWDGDIAEVITWRVVPDRDVIQANINAYYSLY